MNVYAYARVSTKDQNLDRQLEAFTAFKDSLKKIYCDKESGKDLNRLNYQKMIKKMRAGDLLIITSIDRLGRNYDMIIEEWHKITKKIGADIKALDMPLLDTRDQNNSLTGKVISDIVLQLLSYVAETERKNIKQRQREGIQLAKHKGVIFGRPSKKYSTEFLSILQSYLKKELSLKESLLQTGLNKSNFFYHLNKIKQINLYK